MVEKATTARMRAHKRWWRDRLADAGMTYRSLGTSLGTHATSVCHIVNGKRNVKASEAPKIAAILGVEVDDVLARAQAPAPHRREINGNKINHHADISAAQYWEAQAEMWHENYKGLMALEAEHRRFKEALEKIAAGHNGERCRLIAKKAIGVAE